MPYAPILCDLDGTLVDSGRAIQVAVRLACASVRAPVDPGLDLSFCMGPPLEETLSTLLGGERSVPEALAAFRAHFQAAAATPPMPGALEAVHAFAHAGIPLAVATYKPTALAVQVLEATGLRAYFRVVVGRSPAGDDRRKDQLLLQALELLGGRRSTSLYIGDHDEDETAARRAGLAFERYGPKDWLEIQDIALGAGA